MIGRVVNAFRSWRYGGITGLNYLQSQGKMTSIIAFPWLIGYIVCFVFVPDPWLEPTILFMSALWIVYCYGIFTYAKNYVNQFRVFTQSVWQFPDGGSTKYDLLIDPDDLLFLCKFKDGSEGWRVGLGRNYQYWDRRNPDFPYVFNYALWKIPKAPSEAFSFLSQGELFVLGMAIKHSACENISVYVKEWMQDHNGAYVPVCAINDCALTVREFMDDATLTKTDMKLSQKAEMKYRTARRMLMTFKRHVVTLEEIVRSDRKDARSYRKDVEDGLSKIREGCATVMDTKPPLMQRIKGSVWKIVAIIIVVLVVLWFFKLI